MAGKGRAVWVYGIIEKGNGTHPIENRGSKIDNPSSIASAERFTVSYRDLSAVVRGVAHRDIQDMSGEELAARYGPEHQVVLRQLLDTTSGAVVPLSFGSIAESIPDVQSVLARAYLQFKNALDQARGKVEMHVTVHWNEAKEVQHIATTDEEVRRLRKEALSEAGEGGAVLRVQAGRRVFELLRERKQQYINQVTDTLADIVLDARLQPIREESVIFNQAYLLERKHYCAFQRRLDQLSLTLKSHGGREGLVDSRSQGPVSPGLRFQCSGPYPLYNFIDLRLESTDWEAVQQARQQLQLGEEASVADIHAAYRRLAQQWHPDKACPSQAQSLGVPSGNGVGLARPTAVGPVVPDLSGGGEEAAAPFRRIEEAYRILRTYCEHYPCSLRDADVKRMQTVSYESAGQFAAR